MSENIYKEAWEYTLNELHTEYINSGKENDFLLWFNMKYISDTIDTITISVSSAFLKQQMQSKGNFDIVQNKIREVTGQSQITLKIEIENAKVSRENEQPLVSETEEKPKNQKKNTPVKETADKILVNKEKHPMLSEKYTFDNFVAGEDCKFAYKASIAVAKDPGHYKNPFLLYGGSGLGKTHLMQAIGNYIYENAEDNKKICYMTAENFANEYTSSLQGKKEVEFHKKFRNVDVFLLDDIHWLNGKNGLQEQLFCVFEALNQKNAQMVFTIDRPINEWTQMNERLVSRLKSGLSVDLNPPDYETRVAILKKKMELMEKEISSDVIEFIAKSIESNVRELEGALNRIVEYADLMDEEITVKIAKDVLKDFLSTSGNDRISIETIQKVICENYGISLSDIKGKNKGKKFANPRMIAVYLAKEMTEFTYSEIGNEFGGRDHSTIMHAHDKIGDQVKFDPTMNSKIETLKREIKDYKKS
ncbi:MAG: chromosomal replication initiator protein DnaA [Treponema sp.]|nr:chromosomal replication initiator protein DnaA [Treponema sp.]